MPGRWAIWRRDAGPALPLKPGDTFAAAERDLMNLQEGVRRAVDQAVAVQLQAERVQLQSERMKVELIANVSHDLKTPLTSVVNYADLLCEEPLAGAGRTTTPRCCGKRPIALKPWCRMCST